jgi:cyanate lyase
MALQNQTQQLQMAGDYSNHLLVQIELLRCVISHEELSKRLGDVTERCLARYIAGKTHLREDEFDKVAKALAIDARILAQAWAASLGLRLPNKDAVSQMVDRAYRYWRLSTSIQIPT